MCDHLIDEVLDTYLYYLCTLIYKLYRTIVCLGKNDTDSKDWPGKVQLLGTLAVRR